MNITANNKGDDNISLPKIANSHIEEQIVRDDITNEFYMPISSTIVLKRKKEMLYVPLDFENRLSIGSKKGCQRSSVEQKIAYSAP